MKEWALSKGVTHYTLVSSLTGATAEKHDAFFETAYDGSDPVEKFGGAQLIQQEPDASSFQMEESEIHLKQEVTLHGINVSAFILGTTYSYGFISYTGL
jgi:glutamine synthetase